MNDESKNWLKAHAKDSGQKIKDSDCYAGLVTKDFMSDPLCALQLGFAILMDKPLFLIVDKGMKIPGNLTKIASAIEVVDPNDTKDMQRATASLNDFIKTLPKRNHEHPRTV